MKKYSSKDVSAVFIFLQVPSCSWHKTINIYITGETRCFALKSACWLYILSTKNLFKCTLTWDFMISINLARRNLSELLINQLKHFRLQFSNLGTFVSSANWHSFIPCILRKHTFSLCVSQCTLNCIPRLSRNLFEDLQSSAHFAKALSSFSVYLRFYSKYSQYTLRFIQCI